MNKKALGRKHCALAVRRSQKFRPAADPLPGGEDGQNLISWIWYDMDMDMICYLYLQPQFGEDRWTQFRVIVVTDPRTHAQTHKQTGAITIHCAAASLARSVMNGIGVGHVHHVGSSVLRGQTPSPC